MRLVHTADWHLGQTLGGFSRDPEHKRFLAWLLDTIEEERADALLVCGDVFDTGNAPSSAQALYYGFLAELRRRFQELDVVVIGGNHDAAPRLDAPGPILRSLRVHVVGALPRDGDGAVDVESCLVPLLDKSGTTRAVCAAVPFLRMPDLAPQPADVADPVVAGVRDAYRRVLDGARARAARDGGVPLIALGHCHMQGASLTDDSERPVFGNVHPLPADIFPDDVAYAALGHLHFAQSVGGRDNVRYAGSPIPLSMTERPYAHQVLVVDVEGGAAAPVSIRARAVPRTVDLLRVPERALEVKEALEALRLIDVAERPLEERPFLEVRVKLDAPCPDLRTRIESALEGKAVRLVRVNRELAGDGAALADAPEAVSASSLAEIEPAVVLARLYERSYGGAVPADIRAAFDELLEGVLATAAPPPTTPPTTTTATTPRPAS